MDADSSIFISSQRLSWWAGAEEDAVEADEDDAAAGRPGWLLLVVEPGGGSRSDRRTRVTAPPIMLLRVRVWDVAAVGAASLGFDAAWVSRSLSSSRSLHECSRARSHSTCADEDGSDASDRPELAPGMDDKQDSDPPRLKVSRDPITIRRIAEPHRGGCSTQCGADCTLTALGGFWAASSDTPMLLASVTRSVAPISTAADVLVRGTVALSPPAISSLIARARTRLRLHREKDDARVDGRPDAARGE